MTNGYGWLTGQKTDSHQCQADPRQPVLARLTVGVEERPDALNTEEEPLIMLVIQKPRIWLPI